MRRFKIDVTSKGLLCREEHPDGEWVGWSDVEAIIMERDTLVEHLTEYHRFTDMISKKRSAIFDRLVGTPPLGTLRRRYFDWRVNREVNRLFGCKGDTDESK